MYTFLIKIFVSEYLLLHEIPGYFIAMFFEQLRISAHVLRNITTAWYIHCACMTYVVFVWQENDAAWMCQ